MTKPISTRVRLLLVLLLSLGIGACSDPAASDPNAGESRPTVNPSGDDCDDDSDDDGGEDGDNNGDRGGNDDDGGHDGDDDGDDDSDDDGDVVLGDDDDDDGPRFLCEAEDAPSLAQSKVSFYAVRGEARSGSIWYHARQGAADSTELVRLDLGPGSLLAHPDGTPVASGDSVLITMEVKDQERGIIWFLPAGLAFSPSEPARTTFAYGETDDDVNGDGRVDADDETLEAGFAIWRQETEADPFTQLPSQVDQAEERVSADIEGFTRYAVAY